MNKAWIGVVALALSALTGCGSSNGAGSSTGELVVGSWGGDYDNYTKQYVVPAFDESFDGGAPRIVLNPTDVATRATKVLTQKDSDQGDFDVLLQTDIEAARLASEGALDKLDMSKIPNADNVLPALENPYCVPHIYTVEVIIYNQEKVSEAPTSWTDLWDPEHEGEVGIYTGTYPYWFWVAAAAAEGGDPESNIQAGHDLVRQSAAQLRPYTSNEQLGQALISGEVPMAQGHKARAVQWAEAAGDRLDYVIPEEGTTTASFVACIPANAPNKEAAYEFLNAMLDPDAQADFATQMGYTPTVDNVELPADTLERVGLTDEELALVHSLDTEYMAEHSTEQQELWNREVLNK